MKKQLRKEVERESESDSDGEFTQPISESGYDRSGAFLMIFFGRIRMRATHAYIFLKATEKVDYSFMIKHVKSDLDRHN